MAKLSVAGVLQDLNGYKIYLTIKRILDTDVTDATAAITGYAAIATSVTEKSFPITPTQSRIEPGMYVQSFRFVTPSAAAEYTSDIEFEVLPTGTNRNT